jgi:hypothetical protein
MARISERFSLKKYGNNDTRLKLLDGLLNPIGWKTQTKFEALFNWKATLQDVEKQWNIESATPELERSMVETLTSGFYDSALQELDRLQYLVSSLDTMESRLFEALSLNRDTINYCLVVVTLTLSMFLPNFGAYAFSTEIREIPFIIFTISSLIVIVLSTILICECIYGLILLSNIEEDFVSYAGTTKRETKNGNLVYCREIPMALSSISKLYNLLQDWLPRIMTFGAASIIIFLTENAFSEKWYMVVLSVSYFIVVVSIGIKTFIMFGDTEHSSVRFVIEYFNSPIIVSTLDVSSIGSCISRYNNYLTELVDSQKNLSDRLEKFIYYDGWERKLEKKFKYARLLEEAVDTLLEKRLFNTDLEFALLQQKISRYINIGKNFEAWALYEFAGYETYTVAGLAKRHGVDELIAMRFVAFQNALKVQDNVLIIQNVQLKCKTIHNQSKMLVDEYNNVNEYIKEKYDEEKLEEDVIKNFKQNINEELLTKIGLTKDKRKKVIDFIQKQKSKALNASVFVTNEYIRADVLPVPVKHMFTVLKLLVTIVQIFIATVNILFIAVINSILVSLIVIIGAPQLLFTLIQILFKTCFSKREEDIILILLESSPVGISTLIGNLVASEETTWYKITRAGYIFNRKIVKSYTLWYKSVFRLYASIYEKSKEQVDEEKELEVAVEMQTAQNTNPSRLKWL